MDVQRPARIVTHRGPIHAVAQEETSGFVEPATAVTAQAYGTVAALDPFTLQRIEFDPRLGGDFDPETDSLWLWETMGSGEPTVDEDGWLSPNVKADYVIGANVSWDDDGGDDYLGVQAAYLVAQRGALRYQVAASVDHNPVRENRTPGPPPGPLLGHVGAGGGRQSFTGMVHLDTLSQLGLYVYHEVAEPKRVTALVWLHSGCNIGFPLEGGGGT